MLEVDLGLGVHTVILLELVMSLMAAKRSVLSLGCIFMFQTSGPKGCTSSFPLGSFSQSPIMVRSRLSKIAVGWAWWMVRNGGFVYLSSVFLVPLPLPVRFSSSSISVIQSMMDSCCVVVVCVGGVRVVGSRLLGWSALGVGESWVF